MARLFTSFFLFHFSMTFGQPISGVLTPALADSFYFSGNWEQAIPLFEKSIVNGQKNGLIFYRLGYSYGQTGKKEKALSSFYKSIAHKPNPNLEKVVLAAISRVYSEKNQPDSAISVFKRAVKMGYSDIVEIENDSAFNTLRKHPEFEKLHEQILNAAYPCKSQKEARWFDFWVGEWEVFVTGTKNQAGKSKIEKIAGDCAILENWTNLRSSFNGKSINFYNEQTQKWEQHWVGSSGEYQKFENGEYTGDAMRFTFVRLNPDHTTSIGKFTFFNQGPNQVRQLSESSNDQGKNWSADYDFTYIRKNYIHQ